MVALLVGCNSNRDSSTTGKSASTGADPGSSSKPKIALVMKSLANEFFSTMADGIRTSFNGTQRRLGFEQAMKEAGIEIVDSQSANWETNQANTIAASMINTHSDLKAILAANDSMALGAIAAVKGANKSDSIEVVGFDNITAAQEAIREGRMLATADQHGDQLAVFGIEVALQLIADPKANPEDRQTPVDLITKAELTANPQ